MIVLIENKIDFIIKGLAMIFYKLINLIT
jgi:hypothetical protein